MNAIGLLKKKKITSERKKTAILTSKKKNMERKEPNRLWWGYQGRKTHNKKQKPRKTPTDEKNPI